MNDLKAYVLENQEALLQTLKALCLIPALCIGVYVGGGAHTREEWVEKASLTQGLEVAIKSIIALTEEL